jgi:hypothetical protein
MQFIPVSPLCASGLKCDQRLNLRTKQHSGAPLNALFRIVTRNRGATCAYIDMLSFVYLHTPIDAPLS